MDLDVHYTDGVTVKDCKIGWGANHPDWFTHVLEAEAATNLAITRFTGEAAHPERDEAIVIREFPPNMIPRIDGNADDWKMAPDDYAIGMDRLVDDTHKDRKPIQKISRSARRWAV
jgi:hypothetical protein